MKEGIKRAITAAGGEGKDLATALGVSEPFISGAKRRGWLPLERAKMAADLYGIPLADLVRDDIRAAMLRNK